MYGDLDNAREIRGVTNTLAATAATSFAAWTVKILLFFVVPTLETIDGRKLTPNPCKKFKFGL